MARAVVFDCDGVLVDSEPHSAAAWMAALGRYGRAVRAADVAACTGLGYAATYAHLAALPGEGSLPGPDALAPEVLAALAASFDRGLHVFPDAAACV
ncbi:MAG: Haloacid dehalogenase-like hydrolase, partial [Acidobacteria bacterium]|nr:Haloacid dehalogenase-like hydrolase [Acidobacteriota bacterium]